MTGLANRTLQILLLVLSAFLAIAAAAVSFVLLIIGNLPTEIIATLTARMRTSAAAGLFFSPQGRGAIAAMVFTSVVTEGVVILALLRMLASARKGEVFSLANVRRLHWIAGAYALSTACHCLMPLVMPPSATTWLAGAGWAFNVGGLGPALVALVLAQVFREGAGLREEVEATL